MNWKSYPLTRPTECKKYLVCRTDGNWHKEMWNGTGWAYNNKVICFWMEIVSPISEFNLKVL